MIIQSRALFALSLPLTGKNEPRAYTYWPKYKSRVLLLLSFARPPSFLILIIKPQPPRHVYIYRYCAETRAYRLLPRYRRRLFFAEYLCPGIAVYICMCVRVGARGVRPPVVSDITFFRGSKAKCCCERCCCCWSLSTLRELG